MDLYARVMIAVASTLVALSIFMMPLRIDEQAMKVCELSHTHDVCFQALNR